MGWLMSPSPSLSPLAVKLLLGSRRAGFPGQVHLQTFARHPAQPHFTSLGQILLSLCAHDVFISVLHIDDAYRILTPSEYDFTPITTDENVYNVREPTSIP